MYTRDPVKPLDVLKVCAINNKIATTAECLNMFRSEETELKNRKHKERHSEFEFKYVNNDIKCN